MMGNETKQRALSRDFRVAQLSRRARQMLMGVERIERRLPVSALPCRSWLDMLLRR